MIPGGYQGRRVERLNLASASHPFRVAAARCALSPRVKFASPLTSWKFPLVCIPSLHPFQSYTLTPPVVRTWKGAHPIRPTLVGVQLLSTASNDNRLILHDM